MSGSWGTSGAALAQSSTLQANMYPDLRLCGSDMARRGWEASGGHGIRPGSVGSSWEQKYYRSHLALCLCQPLVSPPGEDCWFQWRPHHDLGQGRAGSSSNIWRIKYIRRLSVITVRRTSGQAAGLCCRGRWAPGRPSHPSAPSHHWSQCRPPGQGFYWLQTVCNHLQMWPSSSRWTTATEGQRWQT